jgi:hypothetical protein
MKQTQIQTRSHSELVARRGELMAELFLQDLSPASIARPPQDFGYDFLVVFANSKGGNNTFGVEVKATELPVRSPIRIARKIYDLMAHSTIPGFLLVADVKKNQLFFGFPPRVDTRNAESALVPIPLTQVDEHIKHKLHQKLVM